MQGRSQRCNRSWELMTSSYLPYPLPGVPERSALQVEMMVVGDLTSRTSGAALALILAHRKSTETGGGGELCDHLHRHLCHGNCKIPVWRPGVLRVAGNKDICMSTNISRPRSPARLQTSAPLIYCHNDLHDELCRTGCPPRRPPGPWIRGFGASSHDMLAPADDVLYHARRHRDGQRSLSHGPGLLAHGPAPSHECYLPGLMALWSRQPLVGHSGPAVIGC